MAWLLLLVVAFCIVQCATLIFWVFLFALYQTLHEEKSAKDIIEEDAFLKNLYPIVFWWKQKRQ